jgi:hypothetical protein
MIYLVCIKPLSTPFTTSKSKLMNLSFKSVLIGFLLLIISHCGFGQNSYYVITLKNQPDKIKAVSFLIGGYVDSWNTNQVSLGWVLGTSMYFGKHVDLSVVGRNAGIDQYHVSPNYYNYEEMVVGYNLTSSYKDKAYTLSTASYANGSYEYITPTIVRRTSVALRGGLFHLGSAYSQSQVKAYDQSGPLTGENYMDLTTAVLGISIKNVHYGVFTVDGRRMSTGSCAEYYIDALPLLDAQIPDKVSYLNRFGYRAGLKVSPVGCTGLMFGFEFGVRPGPGDKALVAQSYAEGSLAISFSTKEKF